MSKDTDTNMEILMMFLAMGVWWVIGFVGWVFWWTRKSDFHLSHIGIATMASFLGAFIWIFGFLINYEYKNTLLFKKKSED